MRQHGTVIFGSKLLPQARRRAPPFSYVKPCAHSDDRDYSDCKSNDPRIHQIEVHRNLLETNYLFTTFANRGKTLWSRQYRTFDCGILITIDRLANAAWPSGKALRR